MTAELVRLVRLSAPFTHPVMNRRYEGLAFRLTEDGVDAMGGVVEDAMARRTTGRMAQALCLTCCADGEYCMHCNGKGFLPLPDYALGEGNLLYSRLSQLD